MEYNDKQIGRNIKALRNANNINLLDKFTETRTYKMNMRKNKEAR